MVDCRSASGGPPPPGHTDLPQASINGSVEGHINQQQGMNGDMNATSPLSGRSSTPGNSTTLTTYGGAMGGYGACPPPPYALYGGNIKGGLVWYGPPLHPPLLAPPLPPGVNPHAYKSLQINGSDLPMNDVTTLRYFYNLGVECMWGVCGPPGPPPPPVPPPRHYSPVDLAQDLQQCLSLNDRAVMPNHNGGYNGEPGHKPNPNKSMGQGQQGGNQDKANGNNQGKGNVQRQPLPPRFKRGGNGDGNQNGNQNKGHNNVGNKNPNHRRNSHTDNRPGPNHYGGAMMGGPMAGEMECGGMEQPPTLVSMPYLPYPPPLYSMPYYHVDTDPNMMGMMGGMGGYMGYGEELAEHYPPQMVPQYYPPPLYPPPHVPPPHQQHPHNEHK